MSIRLLLKAFLGNYEKDYPDVTTMDLRELIDNMNIDPDVLAEMSEREHKVTKTIKRYTDYEEKDLRSKFSTTKMSNKNRYIPKAFTEKGLYMLAAEVLIN